METGGGATCSRQLIQGLPACSQVQKRLSGWAGEGFAGTWSGRVKACRGRRKASEAHIPASCVSHQCPPWTTSSPPCPQQGLAQKRPTRCAKPKPQNSRAWKEFSTVEEPVGSQSHFSSRHTRIRLSGECLIASNLRLISSNCAHSGCSSALSQGVWLSGRWGLEGGMEVQKHKQILPQRKPLQA